MIIGITGKNAAGKGEVALVLQEGGYQYYSLSDVLRDELEARKLSPTRDHMIQIGNEIRHQYGASVLAQRILQKIEPDQNYIIDSIRNPKEVEALKTRSNFFLVHVTSLPEIRFERMKARQRVGDPQSLDDFIKLEAIEANSPDPLAQQLDATAALADIELENNGSLDDLRERMRETIRKLSSIQIRPSWDDYFMNIAKMVALRSNCLKRKVAAVIVKDKRIISTGYNGTPRGVKNCNEGGCPRCNTFSKSGVGLEDCYCSHAEENAITQSAYHGVSIKEAVLYTTFSPCLLCTKMIINSGIQEVVFNAHYPMGETPLRLLAESGIRVKQLSY
ncbi:MAG: AAA family ATPase [Deltaproteobacteria bacterium]|nr:AAA family ATPase [Deltaproteobacteria bacterium]